MKNSKIIVLVLCLILPVFMAGCSWFYKIPVLVMQSKYDNADQYVAGNQVYNDVTSIDVDWIAGDVVIVQDTNTNVVEISESNELDDAKKVHSYLDNGVLNIKFWESNLKGFVKTEDKAIVIKVPSLDKIDIKMTSGKLVSESLTADTDIEITMTSGEVNVKNFLATNLAVKMTSGSFNSEKVVLTGKMNFEMTSGKMDLETLVADRAVTKMTSGKLTINSIDISDFDSNITSGKLTLNFENADEISVIGTSGTYNITLPHDATVSVSKTSGSVNSEREFRMERNDYIFGEGTCSVVIKFTTGTLNLK